MAEWPRLRVSDELPRTADLVVVGGGIVGAATAFFARRAGLSVVLLEKRPALCTLTTPVSTGAFRLQFDNSEEIALVREGIGVFDQFQEIAELPGYDLAIKKQGYLFCATTEDGATRQRYFVESQGIVQARFRNGDGWLDPKRLTLGYARASGATICLQTPATGFDERDGQVIGVKTPRGSIACANVVVAAGPFAAKVAALAGVHVDLRPTIRHKLVIPDLPAIPQDSPMTIHEETAAHWRPGLRGCYGLWTEAGTPAGEPLENVPTNADFAFGLLDPRSERSLAKLSPIWERVWSDHDVNWVLQAGQYAYTTDHRPLLGPSAAPGLYLNCGYSGHGIMGSGGGSRIVIDTVLGRLGRDDNPFHPGRPMIERPLDIL